MKQLVQQAILGALLTTASMIAVIAAEEPAVFDIRISERQVVGDNNLIRVSLGDEVVLNWQTDETVSIHLHGYDIEKTIVAGETASMAFTAHATGRYPVTSHGFANQHDDHGHKALMYLEVYPE
jgi:hypothetical protein